MHSVRLVRRGGSAQCKAGKEGWYCSVSLVRTDGSAVQAW